MTPREIHEVRRGEDLVFTITSPDSVNFIEIGSYPTGANLDSATGEFSWTPNSSSLDDQFFVFDFAVVTTDDPPRVAFGSFGVRVLAPEPDVPTGFVATTDSSTEIRLMWPSIEDADEYDVQRRIAGSGTFQPVAALQNVTATDVTDTNLSPGTTYEYQVRATNLQGSTDHNSDWSDTVSATTIVNAPSVTLVEPEQPVTFDSFGITTSNKEVDITWTYDSGSASHPNPDSFVIEFLDNQANTANQSSEWQRVTTSGGVLTRH